MLVFDAILLVILAGFIFYGLFFGLIRTVGSLLAVVAGVWLAALLYEPAYVWASGQWGSFGALGKVAVFFLLYGIINRLVALGFTLLDHLFDFLTIIPFLKTINRLAGALFGLLEGVLIIGLVLHTVSGQPVVGAWLVRSLHDSQVAPYFLQFIGLVKPFFPEVLRVLKSLL